MTERLQFADYCGSEEHQELQWTVDKGDEKSSFHHKFLWSFAKGATRHLAENFRIPVYCDSMESWVEGGSGCGRVRLLHCVYGLELLPDDLRVIADLVRASFYRNGSSCFPEWRGPRKLAWEGDCQPCDPAGWILTGFDEFIGERR